MDATLNKWLRSGVRMNVIESKLMNINEESDSGYGTMHSAITAQPTAPIYNADGSYFDGFLNTRPTPWPLSTCWTNPPRKPVSWDRSIWNWSPSRTCASVRTTVENGILQG